MDSVCRSEDDTMQFDCAEKGASTLYDSSRHLLKRLYRRTRLMSSLVFPENIGPRINCISPCLLVAKGSVPVTDVTDTEPPLIDMAGISAYIRVLLSKSPSAAVPFD